MSLHVAACSWAEASEIAASIGSSSPFQQRAKAREVIALAKQAVPPAAGVSRGLHGEREDSGSLWRPHMEGEDACHWLRSGRAKASRGEGEAKVISTGRIS